MVDSEDDEGCAVFGGLAVLAGAACGCVFKGGDDVFGTEIARSQTVGAGEDARSFFGCKRRQAESRGMSFALEGLVQSSADVASERIVAAHGFVGALENNDIFLALERLDDGGFREGADDVRS